MVSLGLEQFNSKLRKPDTVESLQYLFFERGISLVEFDELPIPYIMSMARVRAYQVEQEEKQSKKKR